MIGKTQEFDAGNPPFRAGPQRVVLLATILTWPLLLVGGSVSVYRVGMAVPDWPTTFGVNMFLYRFWDSSWGVFIEHSHRLYGAAVGLACILLAAWLLARERRAWLKGLGLLALAAVIGQGILGGLRVRWNSTNLAFVHGCTAQAFFGLLVALCVFTGRVWSDKTLPERIDPSALRRRALVTLALAYAQIVIGVWLRHFGDTPLATTPAGPLGMVALHAVLAMAVLGHAAAFAWRIEKEKGRVPELVAAGRFLGVAVVLQVVLGIVAWLALRPFDGIARPVLIGQALVRIAHQGLGALVLASLVVIALQSLRLLVAPVGNPSPAVGARVEAFS